MYGTVYQNLDFCLTIGVLTIENRSNFTRLWVFCKLLRVATKMEQASHYFCKIAGINTFAYNKAIVTL